MTNKRRPDLDSYATREDRPSRVPDLSDPADPVVPEPKKQHDYVLNTRLDPKTRQQLADLQRVSPIPRATLRQVLETMIDREWHREFDGGDATSR